MFHRPAGAFPGCRVSVLRVPLPARKPRDSTRAQIEAESAPAPPHAAPTGSGGAASRTPAEEAGRHVRKQPNQNCKCNFTCMVLKISKRSGPTGSSLERENVFGECFEQPQVSNYPKFRCGTFVVWGHHAVFRRLSVSFKRCFPQKDVAQWKGVWSEFQ